MATRTTHCNGDQLRELLEGTLSGQQEFDVESHIADCDDCRHELETLAAKEDWWRETRELLVGIDSTQAQKAVSVSPFSNCSHNHPPESVEAPALNFLSPSDNPAMLGRLGEFEVLEFIGRGGMGVVLKGYDHELNRFVAIKVLGPHYAENGAARRRFAREAQAAAAVVHQHVVAIHAVDATHQPPYFVMAYVPGEALQQRLDREGPLSIEDVLRIGQQVAEGLAAAHAQGLVHRDIKPSNILLERNVERVLLTDFGLARAVDDASLTQSGIIAGTPQYMSPEQARGESIDARADLFSLGSVLYALLSGHPPFRAESPYGVLRRVTDDEPRPLREVNPEVPEWLDAFIRRLLAKRAEERWATASVVTDLLTQCLAHVRQPTTAALPREVAALVGPARIRRASRIAVVIGVGACVVLFALIRQAWLQANGKQQSDVTQQTAGDRAASDAAPVSIAPGPPAVSPKSMSWEGDHDANFKFIHTRLQQLESQSDF